MTLRIEINQKIKCLIQRISEKKKTIMRKIKNRISEKNLKKNVPRIFGRFV